MTEIIKMMWVFHKNIKGGILLYSVFIMFITSIIICSFIMAAQFNTRTLEEFICRDDLRNAVESGFNIILADNSFPFAERRESIQAICPSDLILKNSIWGLYYLASSNIEYKSINYSKCALYGWNISSTNSIALYLADKKKYLSLSGSAKINGNSYLPSAGVRKANIGAKRFIGDSLINGQILKSNQFLPLIDTLLISHNIYYLQNEYYPERSIQIYNPSNKHITESFNEPTLIIHSENEIIVDNVKITDNVILKSKEYILFTQQAKIENIVAYAPKIYFEEGFTGSVQAIATDSIIVNDNVVLLYPSSLGLINGNSNKTGIDIKAKSEIHGIILVNHNQINNNNPPVLNIDKGVNIYGQVYCSGITKLEGDVFGTIFTNSFRHIIGSAYYDNFIVDAKIDITCLSEYYSGLFMNGISDNKKLIKWLK